MARHASTSAGTANRLAQETSPYLLQHAHNPVDWYPWCEEAFEKARREDKPIFLSVGYSTCYWCHVMERECFERESIAAVMNEHQVNIKVDREERPDVDELYMAAVQVMNRGQGGWPMSVWLDPHTRKPFYAGTYFPPDNHFGRPGFPQVIEQLSRIWRERRDDVEAQTKAVADRIAAMLAAPPQAEAIDEHVVRDAVRTLMSVYDRQHGGFGGAPKFPQPVYLELLLNAAGDEEDVQQAIRQTLNRMAIGGMYDQVGGGFHRYSVDQYWLVPHFEKMLYDNGQLVALYAKAGERFDDGFYRQIARETLDYVLREMTHEKGGFFSAQDAEVNAREGENYLWTADQVRDVLRDAGMESEIDFIMHVYGLDRGTNFRDPHDENAEPKNVLHMIDRPEPLARAMGIPESEFHERLVRINAVLLAARDQRDQPGTDDKILAGWNGLMIAGFAEGGRVLGERKYIDAAARAARFILDEMRDDSGELYRSFREGEARVPAFLEDYALLAHGLLTLHNATDDEQWLNAARELIDRANRHFRDGQHGGYFATRADQSDLFLRVRAAFDGAVPSGASVMIHNLLDANERTGDAQALEDTASALTSMSAYLKRAPTGLALATLALHRMAERYPERLASTEQTHKRADEPVTAELNTDSISLPHSGHVTVELRLRMREGYHINAHDPGVAGLEPLRIELDGEGAAAEVDYPEGDPLENAAFAGGSVRVHSGDLVLPLRIQRTGDFRGKHRVLITCQPCTNEMCHQPLRITLPLRIEAA